MRLKVKITKERAIQIIREEVIRKYRLFEDKHDTESGNSEESSQTLEKPVVQDWKTWYLNVPKGDLRNWYVHLNTVREASGLTPVMPKSPEDFEQNLKVTKSMCDYSVVNAIYIMAFSRVSNTLTKSYLQLAIKICIIFSSSVLY